MLSAPHPHRRLPIQHLGLSDSRTIHAVTYRTVYRPVSHGNFGKEDGPPLCNPRGRKFLGTRYYK
jgi:hypothetical protein